MLSKYAETRSGAILTKAIEQSGKTLEVIAEQTDVTHTYIVNCRSGKDIISEKSAIKLHSVLQFDLNDLLTAIKLDRNDKRFKKGKYSADIHKQMSDQILQIDITDNQPLINLVDFVPIICTTMEGIQNIMAKVKFEGRDYLALPKGVVPDVSKTYALKTSGDNMRGFTIEEGDLIIINTASNVLKDNDITVFLFEDIIYIRKMFITPDGYIFNSSLSNIPPIVINKDAEDFSLVGKIIGIIKLL